MGCVRHLVVKQAVRVSAKSLVLETVDMGGVLEGGVREDKVTV